MHSLMSKDHNAFIHALAIQDNIVLTRKAFHSLRTSNSHFHIMVVNMDMHKVYSHFLWNFLRKFAIKDEFFH